MTPNEELVVNNLAHLLVSVCFAAVTSVKLNFTERNFTENQAAGLKLILV